MSSDSSWARYLEAGQVQALQVWGGDAPGYSSWSASLEGYEPARPQHRVWDPVWDSFDTVEARGLYDPRVAGSDFGFVGGTSEYTTSVSTPGEEVGASPNPSVVGPVNSEDRRSDRKPALGFRLRRRGLNTQALKNYLADEKHLAAPIPGGNTSDWVIARWMNILRKFPGGKLLSAERVVLSEGVPPTWAEELIVEEGTPAVYDWVLEFESASKNRFTASLSLYVKLMTYVVFRQRHREMPAALRVRAVQTAKELGMSTDLTALVLPGTIALAMFVTYQELSAWDSMMDGRAAGMATTVTAEVASGRGSTLYRHGNRLFTAIVGGLARGRVLPQVVS